MLEYRVKYTVVHPSGRKSDGDLSCKTIKEARLLRDKMKSIKNTVDVYISVGVSLPIKNPLKSRKK